MKIKLLTLAIVWLFTNVVFAQKENYIWYFGNLAGLDFNSGVPMALTNGAMYTPEGCASMSDANGNLLFYTDGIKVWDRNHIQMPNGDSLGGGPSSAQAALIVPFPGSNTLCYIFTTNQKLFSNNNFCYTVVDMSLNSGNGEVTSKNNIIITPVAENLTAVKHANNTDVWVMVHDKALNNFYAYLVTAAGVASNPVVSNVGQNLSTNDGTGQMKFSPDGTKIVFATATTDFMDLFDFNASTGAVTNEICFVLPPTGNQVYGLEFSASGKYLYAGKYDKLYQWDITSNDSATIVASQVLVGTTVPDYYGSLQLGPDGKIYIIIPYTQYVAVINSPDSLGSLCNYVGNAVYLSGNTCRYGLPNFITSYFLPTGINTNNPPQNQLIISPNPATDKITISFAGTTAGNITIKIYAITGEVVFSEEKKSTAPITNYQLPVTNLTNGIYFLSVQTGREVVTKRKL